MCQCFSLNSIRLECDTNSVIVTIADLVNNLCLFYFFVSKKDCNAAYFSMARFVYLSDRLCDYAYMLSLTMLQSLLLTYLVVDIKRLSVSQ